jgi:hypothetical protein
VLLEFVVRACRSRAPDPRPRLRAAS